MTKPKLRAIPEIAQTTTRVRLGDIATHPKNPKEHDIGELSQSFDEIGFFGLIGVWEPKNPQFEFVSALLPKGKTYWCIYGAGRIETAYQRGARDDDTIPAVVLDVPKRIAAKILLAENQIGRKGGFDISREYDFLTSLIAEEGGDIRKALAGSGYDGDDVDALAADMKHADGDGHSPFSQFREPTAAEGYVMFHFGDHHGRVSTDVYTAFKRRYSELRDDVADSDTGMMLDDVIRAWLSL